MTNPSPITSHGFTLKGFTLIELLVVVSIIGILTTLLFANLNTARERGRDAQRKSDIRNMQTALRLYYNDKGEYPTSDSDYRILGCGSGGTSLCDWGGTWSVGSTIYMSILPKEPQADRAYRYEQSDSDTYTLKACLENKSDDKCSTTTEVWCNTTANGCLYIVSP